MKRTRSTQRIVESFSTYTKKSKLNEGMYEDFREKYRDELIVASSKYIKMANANVSDFTEAEYEELMENLEKALSQYDQIVIDDILNNIGSQQYFSRGEARDDIVDLAFNAMNRFGTEMQMTLRAIDDAYEFLSDESVVDDIDDVNESETSCIKRVQKDINKYKKSLIQKAKSKGIYENFGQTEVRKLEDKYKKFEYGSPEEREAWKLIREFDEWVMVYNG